MEKYVRQKVAAGEFTSAGEMLCEGLRLLQQQEVSDSRRKIDLGWDQAKSGQLRSPEDARREIAVRKETWKLSRGK